MKICILGAGALGSTIGGALASSGEDVYLINRRQSFVDKVNKDGLEVTIDDQANFIPLKAQTTTAGIGPVDLVIVLVKSFHTKEVMEQSLDIVGEDTVVMSLQNGLGNEEVLAEVVGKEKIIGAKTYVGGVMLSPGHVLSGIRHKYTYIGEMDGAVTERLTRISTTFKKAGLDTVVSDNILGIIWDKLLVNVATGAISTITRLTYGDLYAIPEIEAIALKAVEEGIQVAKAHHIELATDDARSIWLQAKENLPDSFKTSMLQSVEKGSITEIDYINNGLVTWGNRVNVPTPVNETLVASVKGIEASLKN